jgi:hypothetical protein
MRRRHPASELLAVHHVRLRSRIRFDRTRCLRPYRSSPCRCIGVRRVLRMTDDVRITPGVAVGRVSIRRHRSWTDTKRPGRRGHRRSGRRSGHGYSVVLQLSVFGCSSVVVAIAAARAGGAMALDPAVRFPGTRCQHRRAGHRAAPPTSAGKSPTQNDVGTGGRAARD